MPRLSPTYFAAPLKSCARACVGVLALALAGACGTLPVAKVDGHLKNEPTSATPRNTSTSTTTPQPVRQVPLPPPPQARVEEVRYSITVKDVPVQDLLFAISRDTKVNIDVHGGIDGRVTLNAIDQTLKQILTRVGKQVDMRFDVEGTNIVVMPDSPFLKLYRVDYVNMTRDSTGSIGVQTQVVGPAGVGAAAAGGAAQNSSTVKLENTSKNRFWESLEKNIRDMLRETDKLLPEGSSETVVRGASQGANTAATRAQTGTARTAAARGTTTVTGPGETQTQSESVSQTLTFREAASVIMNPETGTIAVRATSRQHEKVGEFIEQIAGSARRQVLIEATVVEVLLNDNYQGGVDWSALGIDKLGYTIRQNFTGARLNESPFFSVEYSNPRAAVGGSIGSVTKLLNTFGQTRVLSSPKIMTLNNQTAVMKVVENKVYFTVQSTVTPGQQGQAALVVYTSTPNVVPEGFVMNVTPQISDRDMVNLNVRPSVTRITGFARDPNPDLARANVTNQIPEIQTREFESMLRLVSGQTAMMGGLMQDSFANNRDGLPVLARVPLLGDAVSFRNDTGRKSEFVVFLRATVIRDASVETDMADYKRYLPSTDFFRDQSPSLDPNNPNAMNANNEPKKAP